MRVWVRWVVCSSFHLLKQLLYTLPIAPLPYDVMGGGGKSRQIYIKHACSCALMFKTYMKAQKHACFRVPSKAWAQAQLLCMRLPHSTAGTEPGPFQCWNGTWPIPLLERNMAHSTAGTEPGPFQCWNETWPIPLLERNLAHSTAGWPIPVLERNLAHSSAGTEPGPFHCWNGTWPIPLLERNLAPSLTFSRACH